MFQVYLRGDGYAERMRADSKLHKILIVVGTRPEVIKMAPVYLEFNKHPDLEVLLCATGQHSDLLNIALEDFDLSPDYRLELMQHGQGLGSLTSRALTGLEKIYNEVKPDAVLVHGDTTTTFAAALVAFYAHIPIGHVEAGLRTGDIYSPFPEEFYRQSLSRLALWNFAPTEHSKQNLLAEGVEESRILVTGNTVVDSLGLILSRESIHQKSKNSDQTLGELVLNPGGKFILTTFHRRENLNDGFEEILEGIRRLAESNPTVDFVFPMHPNLEVRKRSSLVLGSEPNVLLIEPLGYASFISLLARCLFVISDSGGIQEEAVTLGKKLILTRTTTERPEGLNQAGIIMAGTSSQRIQEIGEELLRGSVLTLVPRISNFTFGDGQAAKRICAALQSDLKKHKSS